MKLFINILRTGFSLLTIVVILKFVVLDNTNVILANISNNTVKVLCAISLAHLLVKVEMTYLSFIWNSNK